MKTQSEEQAFKSASTTLDNKYKRYFESEVAEHGNQVPMSSFSPTGSLFQQKANENHLEIVH